MSHPKNSNGIPDKIPLVMPDDGRPAIPSSRKVNMALRIINALRWMQIEGFKPHWSDGNVLFEKDKQSLPASGIALTRAVITSVGTSTLTCKKLATDGTNYTVGEQITVYMPWSIRADAWNGKTINGHAYANPSFSNAAQTRTEDGGTQNLSPYYVADSSYAGGTTGPNALSVVWVTTAESGRYEDVNADGRHWASESETEPRPIGMVFRGEWSSLLSYSVNDVVVIQGGANAGTYVCAVYQAAGATSPGEASNSAWFKIAPDVASARWFE